MKRGFFRPLPLPKKMRRICGAESKIDLDPGFRRCDETRLPQGFVISGGSRNPGFLGTLRDSYGLTILNND